MTDEQLAQELIDIAEDVPKVYEAGQKSMTDESKIIPKTVTGKRFVSIDDVSEVPHDVEISVSSDCNISVYEKNLFNIETSVSGALSVLNGGVGSNGSYDTSDYIRVYENETYTMSSCRFLCAYDADKKFIVGINTGTTERYTYTIPQGVAYIRFTYANHKVKTQVELGAVSTGYKPYEEPITYTTKNGKLTIPSAFPCMTVLADSDVDITINYRKSYGMQLEYDRAWDNFQQCGERENYRGAFAGAYSWLLMTYGGIPKYNIKIKDTSTSTIYAYAMFMNYDCGVHNDCLSDMTEVCKHIDFSECIAPSYTFWNARVKNVTCDFSNAVSMTYTFNCNSGGRMDNIHIKVTEKCTSFANTFTNNSNLTELRFMDGSTIAANFDVRWCPLTIESALNVLTTLTKDQTLAIGKTATFKSSLRTEIEADPQCAEQIALAVTAGWTIAYA